MSTLTYTEETWTRTKQRVADYTAAQMMIKGYRRKKNKNEKNKDIHFAR
jgi:hypothetical protein